jgi:hypothetical protein
MCHFMHECEDKLDDDEYQWSERKWIIFGIHRPNQFEKIFLMKINAQRGLKLVKDKIKSDMATRG